VLGLNLVGVKHEEKENKIDLPPQVKKPGMGFNLDLSKANKNIMSAENNQDSQREYESMQVEEQQHKVVPPLGGFKVPALGLENVKQENVHGLPGMKTSFGLDLSKAQNM